MSSKNGYSLIEPHPTASSPYFHTARGGAGNVAKLTSSKHVPRASNAATPNSRTSRTTTDGTTKKAPLRTGRGGAGNIHHNSERAIFSFDEELERQMRQEKDIAPVYHVGRGGAGNMVYIDGSKRRRSSETASATSESSSGTQSGADVAARNIKRNVERGWSKVVGVGNYMIG